MALTDEQKKRRRQFLDFIGWSEGADYNTIVGGKRFTDFSKHPRVVGFTGPEGDSTAAGRYQIVGKTYDALRAKYKYGEDFGPSAQDEMATRLIKDRGALTDVDMGNWRGAINKLGEEWASFPSSPYNQPKRSWPEAMSFFGGGGTGGMPGEGPNNMVTSDMLMDMYRQAMTQIEGLEGQQTTQENQLATDFAGAGQRLDAADEATRSQIMQQPIQEERGVGQRAIASILGGATQRGVEGEEALRRQQIQKQHDELTDLSITRTKRLADAYYKMDDIVNAVKYTAAAQKLVAAKKDAADLLHQAASISGAKEVANINATGRGAAAPASATPVMMPDEYSKALNAAITQYKTAKKNPLALKGLRAELANMRHTGQTPIAWIKNLYYGIIPPGDRKFFGLLGGDKGLFDIGSNADQLQIGAALDNLFTPQELADPSTGTDAVVKWLQTQRGGGGAPPPREDVQVSAVSMLKRQAAENVRLIANTRRKLVNTSGDEREALLEDMRAFGKQLAEYSKALKQFGVELGPEDLEMPGITAKESRPSYFGLGR